MGHKLYVASSWRNGYQPELVDQMRSWGHEVYDFRNPDRGNTGFHRKDMDPERGQWITSECLRALSNPIAEYVFKMDMKALEWCEVTVLLLPSGNSAHSEAGWYRGRGGPVIVHSPEQCQPELMYKMFSAITTEQNELQQTLAIPLVQLRSMELSKWKPKPALGARP